MERLERDAVQSACSAPRGMPLDNEMLATLREERLNAVVLPADGQYLGDWQRGAEVAGNGRGLQSSDDPTKPNGGNCYACHQLAPMRSPTAPWPVINRLRRSGAVRAHAAVYLDQALGYPCL
jgi:hypothetical protein